MPAPFALSVRQPIFILPFYKPLRPKIENTLLFVSIIIYANQYILNENPKSADTLSGCMKILNQRRTT